MVKNVLILVSVILASNISLIAQSYPIEESVQTSDGVTLYGTLLNPADSYGLPPLAIIVAGSGATDRDGNSPGMRSDAYKMLCEELAQCGIATLRYDKRGIGKSVVQDMKEEQLTFDGYAQDILYWVEKYSASSLYSRIVLIGHSEGSLLCILAAQKDKNITGVVSLCGAGRNIADILKEQLLAQPSGAALSALTTPIIDSLQAGHQVKNVPAMLYSLFRPSVQPFMIQQMRYYPALEIQKLNCPLLIIGGTHDVQIKQADYKALCDAVPSAQKAMIENMSHVLKHTTATDLTSQLYSVYMNPALPLSSELVKEIKNFVK